MKHSTRHTLPVRLRETPNKSPCILPSHPVENFCITQGVINACFADVLSLFNDRFMKKGGLLLPQVADSFRQARGGTKETIPKIV